MAPARELILVMALAGFAAAPVQAAFPGRNGAIAFDRSVGESTYVHVARSDGTHIRRLLLQARPCRCLLRQRARVGP